MNYCKHCGKEMPITFGGRSVYCSKECSQKHKKIMMKMGREHTHCVVCGKLLTGHQKKFCSANCRLEERRKYLEEYHENNYKKPETKPKKKAKKPVLSLAEINARARAEGLNYGQYVAKYHLY